MMDPYIRFIQTEYFRAVLHLQSVYQFILLNLYYLFSCTLFLNIPF